MTAQVLMCLVRCVKRRIPATRGCGGRTIKQKEGTNLSRQYGTIFLLPSARSVSRVMNPCTSILYRPRSLPLLVVVDRFATPRLASPWAHQAELVCPFQDSLLFNMDGFVEDDEPDLLLPPNSNNKPLLLEAGDVALVSRQEGEKKFTAVLYIRPHLVELQHKLHEFLSSIKTRNSST
jgi:hypothetical protein